MNDPYALPSHLRKRVRSEIEKELANVPCSPLADGTSWAQKKKEFYSSVGMAYFYRQAKFAKLGLAAPEKKKLPSIIRRARSLHNLLKGYPLWADLLPGLDEIMTVGPQIEELSKDKRGPVGYPQQARFCHLMAGVYRSIYGDGGSWPKFHQWLNKWCGLLEITPPSEHAIRQGIKAWKRSGGSAILLFTYKAKNQQGIDKLQELTLKRK